MPCGIKKPYNSVNSTLKTGNMDLRTIISSIQELNKEDLDAFTAICRPIEVRKHSCLIEANRVDNRLYFIQEGIARAYYETPERSINLLFAGPGESVLSLNSYSLQKPGYEAMETLTDSLLYQVDALALKELYQHNIRLANWGRKFAEREFIKAEERLMSTRFKTAQERYEELLAKDPQLPQKIKLGHIASYLGVTQVTLSRIRANNKG